MKIDFHCHSYYSKDGISSPEALIRAAKNHGLDGIALTDHNTTSGWEDAKDAARVFDAVFIPGEEIKIKEGKETVGEILGYFLKKEVNSKGKTAKQVVDEIHAQGGIAIIAHPLNWRKPNKKYQEWLPFVDGIEAFNSRSQTARDNIKTTAMVKENEKLVATAGSDCHSSFEAGRSYLEIEAKNEAELKTALLKKAVTIHGAQEPIFIQIFATLGRIMHLFWKP